MLQAYAYLLHLISCFVLLAVFLGIYTKVTPFDELVLLREGNVAAALALAGAMLGFSLTLASSVMHSDDWMMFSMWGIGSMIVQVITYAIVERALPHMRSAIEQNNAAMGTLMGSVSLTVGIFNAACLF